MRISDIKKQFTAVASLLIVSVVGLSGIAAPASVSAASGWKTAAQCKAESTSTKYNPTKDDTYYFNCLNNNSVEGMTFRAYQVVLGRYPDPSGFKYWSGVAAKNINGDPTAAVVNGLMTSAAFKNRAAGQTDSQFISTTYNYAFNVENGADPSGLTYWVGRLNSKTSSHLSRAELLANFTQQSRTKTVWSLEVGCYFGICED